MKIAIVSNLYRPYSRGGAEIIARRVALELHHRGHKVFVVSTRPFDGIGTLHEHRDDRDILRMYRFYPFNCYHMLSDFSVPFFVRAAWHLLDLWSPHPKRVLDRIFKREQPDVVLTHNMKGFGMQALKAVANSEALHIHTLHDVQLSVPSGLLLAGQEQAFLNTSFLRSWYEKQVQKIVASPKVVISPSKFLADFYQQRGFFPASDLRVIPNPAPDIDVHPKPQKADKKLHLLFVGQLERHKGILMLLDIVNRMGDDVMLHIAGEGSMQDYVQTRAKLDKRIHYHGFIPFEHLVHMFDLCDVTLVPSLCYENSPTVIYESFQAGVPVIASNIGGVGELVKDGENGYLITPGDADALRKAIEKMRVNLQGFHAKSEDLQREMKKLSLRRYVNQLEEIMEQKVQKKAEMSSFQQGGE
jgi:glycosyltransferase involved in cell wall biosynthesis